MNAIVKAKTTLDRLVNAAAIALVAAMLVIVAAQVFYRYAMVDPIGWSEEAARFLFIWMVFIGTAIAYREGQHLVINLLFGIRNPRIKMFFNVAEKVCELALVGVILWCSPLILDMTYDQISPSLEIRMAYIYGAFTVSMLLVLVEIVYRFIVAVARKGETA